MLKKVLSVSLLASVSAFSAAESYKTEVSGELTNVNGDGNGLDYNIITAGIRYHFLDVFTSGKPYAEAAFLQQSSNVFASHSHYNGDLSSSNSTTGGAEIFVPESILYFGASITRFDSDYLDDDTDWSVTAGVTPVDGLLVTTTHSEDEDYDFNLAAKYVTKLSDGRFINVIANFEDDDDDAIYGAGVDYYVNRTTSYGILVQDSGDNTAFSLRGKHFFSPAAYVGLAYVNSDGYNSFLVSGGFRF